MADVKVNFLEKEKPPPGSPGSEEVRKERKPIPLWAIILVVSQIAIFSTAWFVFRSLIAARNDAKNVKPKTEEVVGNYLFAFEPITVNVISPNSDLKVLEIRVSFETDRPRVHSEVIQNSSQTRDELIMLLSSKSEKDLNSPQKMEALREEIIAKANRLLKLGQIKNLYITHFVVKEKTVESDFVEEAEAAAITER